MMTGAEIIQNLRQVDALVRDSHIVYTSGRHGSAYVNKDAIYPHTHLTSRLCHELASHFSGQRIDTVLAPALCGIILSQWVAFHLSDLEGREVAAIYAEKDKQAERELFVIKRGYDKCVTGRRILLLEDVLTTGISIKRVVEAVRSLRGEIVGVGALCNRGGVSAEELAVPELFSLVAVNLESWEAGVCPLCAKGVPVNTDVGKGREFLAKIKGA